MASFTPDPTVHPVARSARRNVVKPSRLRRRVTSTACGFALLLGSFPAFSRAADDAPEHDGRLEGYSDSVALEKSGVGLTWLLFIVLSLIGCSVLFKNAKRSHLD